MKFSIVLLFLALVACYFVSGWAMDAAPAAFSAVDASSAYVVAK